MKTKKLASKLTLAKETLRSLDSQDLSHAHAGDGSILPGFTVGKHTCFTCQDSVCIC